MAADSHTRTVGAWIHRGKGVGNDYNVQTLCEFGMSLGYKRMILKCDQEPSILALRTETATRLRQHGIDMGRISPISWGLSPPQYGVRATERV